MGPMLCVFYYLARLKREKKRLKKELKKLTEGETGETDAEGNYAAAAICRQAHTTHVTIFTIHGFFDISSFLGMIFLHCNARAC